MSRSVSGSRSELRGPVVLFGGTDVTLAVAEAAMAVGVRIAAVITIGEAYRISYSKGPVLNSRHADVRKWCVRQGVPAVPFTTYEEALGKIAGPRPALGLVAGWYHMVPKRVRQRFRLGCLGFHASLLPKLRGGTPLNWAILSDLRETGVTMFKLGDGIDDGPVYAQQRFRVYPESRISDLIGKATVASAALTRRHLLTILAGKLRCRSQKGLATYGLQRRPEDGRIDWTQPALEIHRLVRAVGRPYPGAYSELEGKRVFIWDSRLPRRTPPVLGAPGQIARLPGLDTPCVVTGKGILAVTDATDAQGASALDRLVKSTHKRFGP